MITAEAVLATFPGATEITSREDEPPNVDCWHANRHRGQHQAHPLSGRIVCFTCHPPGDTGHESPFKMVTNVGEWGKGSFRGGPLDGHTHDVPKHGPAFIRWHDERSGVHWYSIKPKTARTYVHLGTTPSEGLRSDLAPHSGRQLTLAPPAVHVEPIDMDTLGAHVTAIIGSATSGYVELRALDPDNQKNNRQIWIDGQDPDRTRKAAEFIERMRATHSVYIGCAPRVRRRGALKDVEHAYCLWGDCDSPQSTARLFEFTPAPSFVFTSGRAGHVHFLYILRSPIPAAWVRPANRRLARALDADMAPTHAASVLRPVGSVNRRNGNITSCVYLDTSAIYSIERVVGHLPDEPKPPKSTMSASTSPTRISGLLGAIRNAPAGTARGYNVTLHWAAARCAEHIDRGELDAEAAYQALYEVGLEVDLGEHATHATLRSAGLE
jgi:hypothetical protein